MAREESGVYYAGRFHAGKGASAESFNPTNGELLVRVSGPDRDQYDAMVDAAMADHLRWRVVPAPQRGELVRKMGNALREHKEALGSLISREMGKVHQEGLGEVQEAIDIADFAVGLSRQLYGVTSHSERPSHRLYEQWHPLGVNAYITAFNFPVAVWAWNAMIGAVCGNSMIWKPSSKTPLCAIEVQKIIEPILKEAGFPSLMCLAAAGRGVGSWIAEDRRIPLISFTGSTETGRDVARTVNGRLGRTILELGGNNALIVTPSADWKLALPALVFGSVGTAGQRCTSTRRLIIHRDIKDAFIQKSIHAYGQIRIGDPLAEGTLMGPLIDKGALKGMQAALESARQDGATVLTGGEVLTTGELGKGAFVTPAIVDASPDLKIMREETFAPILYVLTYETLQEALEIHNSVDQGLSSSIFTTDMRESEYFLSHAGSDCGIANVNTGTSGAEIGLAFGGEKDTGGGRESGSDAWKVYMRRQSNTINWSSELPLAQGLKFDID